MARLLLIDDDPLVLRVLGRALRMHEVVSFSSSREAVDCVLGGEQFDAAIVDFEMPELDGAGVLAELREGAAALAERTFIMTGAPARAQAACPDALVVRKPVGIELLYEIVDRLLS